MKILLFAALLFPTFSLAQETNSVLITGNKKGHCTPDMPMMTAGEMYQIQFQGTNGKSFVLDSPDLGIHLTTEPGATATQVITPAKGDYDFTCGDQALPENERTQGMFMVM